MAFAVASIGSVGDTAARSEYTCELARAPDGNTLVLVGVAVTDTTGTAVEPTDVVGAGITFSLITSSVSFNAIASPAQNLSVWRGMAASPSGSRITATFDNAGTGCAILVHEVSGVSTAGSNGANAVGKSATSRKDGADGPDLVLIGPSATSTANAWIAFHSSNSQEVSTANVNYQAVDEVIYLAPDSAFASAWTTLSTGNQVTWANSASDARGGVLVELVLDNPAAPPPVVPSGTPRRPIRIPPVPSSITGPIAQYLGLIARQLNSEGYISLFSGANPNSGSGVTGIPGNMVVNIGSASSNTRLWIMGGSSMSAATTGWVPLRTA